MPKPSSKPSSKPVARLTTPAEMVASLPLWLGYVPSESLVLVCCHEPRGRIGLTMRIDLPAPWDAEELVEELAARVEDQQATRVLLAIYSEQPDGLERAHRRLADGLREAFEHLVVTELVLVRDGRFWSYLCDDQRCCPAEGTAVDAGAGAQAVTLLEAELVLEGKAVQPSREALAATLAGPSFLAAQVATQRCDQAADLLAMAWQGVEREDVTLRALDTWAGVVRRWRHQPAELSPHEAAALAVSLSDTLVRDVLAGCEKVDVEPMRALLAELCRRTPPPWDAAVCTLYGWITYCHGGGAEVTIALVRALNSDPGYTMANLLLTALNRAVPPKQLRSLTVKAAKDARRLAG